MPAEEMISITHLIGNKKRRFCAGACRRLLGDKTHTAGDT